MSLAIFNLFLMLSKKLELNTFYINETNQITHFLISKLKSLGLTVKLTCWTFIDAKILKSRQIGFFNSFTF